MPGLLTVVHGPFEALEDAFCARVAELRPGPDRPPILIVAPSRAMLDRLQRLLAVERGMALLGAHARTFHGLAEELCAEGGWPPGEAVSDALFHDLLVDRVLDRTPALARDRALRPRALASSVRASLRDLLDAGVDARAVAESFGDALAADPEEAERLGSLLAALSAYEAELARLGVAAPSATVRRAAELAPRSSWLAGFREVLYYGFYDLTGLQADVFEAVTASRPSRLYFPYRRGHPAFRFADEFFEVKLAGSRREEVGGVGGAGTALGAAVDALFDPAAPPAPVREGRARVISASGERGEAWVAAKEAARFLSEGIAPSEIAVIARTLAPYRAALAEAFAEEGVPLELRCGEPILRLPWARAALDLLSLRRRDFPARAVGDLIASPYFSAASPARAALWRRLIEALDFGSGWRRWRGKLEARGGAGVELLPGLVAQGLPGFEVPAEDARALGDFLDGVRAVQGGPPSSWSQTARRARELIESALGRRPPEPTRAELDALAAIDAALSELALFDRLGEDCSWDEFLDAFERKLENTERDGGAGGGGVGAFDAMDARGRRFEAAILIGLHEGSFPRRVAEDPILRDGARAALRHPGGYWIGRKSAGHEEERLLFYLAASCARSRLTLVYSRLDEDGRARTPSIYLRELCRAAGLAPASGEEARAPRPPGERLRWASGELTPRETALLCALDGAPVPEALEQAGVPARSLNARFELARELSAPGRAGRLDGLVGDLTPELARWRRAGMSPSALDQYARCPYQFFAARVLGLPQRIEEADSEAIDPAERGRLYHRALEIFHRAPHAAGSEGGAGEAAALEEAIAAALAPGAWRELGVYPLLWEIERGAMAEHLRAFARWDAGRLKAAGLSPRLIEAQARSRCDDEAGGGMSWRGVIDRVDVDEAARTFRVVDYKTRRSAAWKAPLARLIGEGTSHQIPIYARLAAETLGEGWSFDGADLLFLEAEDDGARASTLTADEWLLAREPFERALAARMDDIRAGRFPISPEDGEHGRCARCAFATVCRRAHGPTRARAAAWRRARESAKLGS